MTTINNKILVKNLNIASINVNSLIFNERRASLTEFLDLHNPDVTFLCETKLNLNHKLAFKNYMIDPIDQMLDRAVVPQYY